MDDRAVLFQLHDEKVSASTPVARVSRCEITRWIEPQLAAGARHEIVNSAGIRVLKIVLVAGEHQLHPRLPKQW